MIPSSQKFRRTSGYLKTTILMAGMTALVMAIGSMVGGRQGMTIALGFAGLMNLWAWFNSDKAVLRRYNAKPVGPADAPQLYQTVERLARNAQLPMPRVYIIENEQPNAFATGRNPQNAAVAVNTGLLSRLRPDEVEGVIAHELAHIRHRDTLIMTVTATFAGAISMLANFGMMFGGGQGRERSSPLAGLALVILAPLAAGIVQMAISRTREFEADKAGAEISGRPRALASALAAISGHAELIDNIQAENNPATAHMFIINPLHMRSVDTLFATHPKTEERIRRLLEMDQQGGFTRKQEIDDVFGDPLSNFGHGFEGGKKNPWA